MSPPAEVSPNPTPGGVDPVTGGSVATDRRSVVPASLRRVLRKCGIDRAIGYTLLGRGWGVIATPLSWLFISRRLLPAEQGFYYTFSSVIALNVFLELGLTFVLLQFASHEKAHLEWTEKGILEGSQVALGRLLALLRTALKWYAVAAFLVILLVMPGGILFFSRGAATTFSWRGPWVVLALASAINLLTSPLLAVLEGCGKVYHIAFLRLAQSVAANAALWITLMERGALYASPAFQIMNVAVAVVWLWAGYRHFFISLLRNNGSAAFQWWVEVWPFQWRIALSWLGGYFFSQVFNPVLFATRGPVVAGQMGMSLSICNAFVTVSFAWMGTKASPFGVLVAKRDWRALDTLFFRTARQSLVVLFLCGAIVFGGTVNLPHYYPALANRILPPVPFGLLIIACLMNHVLYCEALYLRTHKSEPFLIVSIVGGALTAIATIATARPYGALGVMWGNLICTVITLAMGTWVFCTRRKKWHA